MRSCGLNTPCRAAELDLLVMCSHSTAQHPIYYLTCMLPVSREVEDVEKKLCLITIVAFRRDTGPLWPPSHFYCTYASIPMYGGHRGLA